MQFHSSDRSQVAQMIATLRAAIVVSLIVSLAVPVPTFAAPKKTRIIDDAVRFPLKGNIHPSAKEKDRVGPSDRNLKMERMVLVLGVRPGAEAELKNLIAAQHDPSSPLYHQWLTPEQFGQRFGVSDDDIVAVTNWLESHGLTIDEVANGRGWINFSGNAGQVEQAFKTEMSDYIVDGKLHHANRIDPSIPRGLADIVKGVLTLHDFYKRPANTGFKRVESDPEYTSGSSHYIAPADFAKIYNVNPLYTASVNGTGQTIAIVGRTDINVADVQYFRSFFGLPAKDPVITHNGTAPGNLGGGEEGEADLDVQWSGAVAKNATINFVVSKSTATTDGVDLSAQYIVNNNLAAAMSVSFG